MPGRRGPTMVVGYDGSPVSRRPPLADARGSLGRPPPSDSRGSS